MPEQHHHIRLRLPAALVEAISDAERDCRLCAITPRADMLTRQAREIVGAIDEASASGFSKVQAIRAGIDIDRKCRQANANLLRMNHAVRRVQEIAARRREEIDRYSRQQLQAAEPLYSEQVLLLLDHAARIAQEVIDAAPDIGVDSRQQILTEIGRTFAEITEMPFREELMPKQPPAHTAQREQPERSPDEPVVEGRCGAKRKRGGRCRAHAMPNGRCQHHGGMSPAPGPTHPNYRHGRYSKLAIKPELAEKIDAAESDPELLSLRADVALVEVKIGELLERFDESTPDLKSWQTIRKLVTKLQELVAEEKISPAFRLCDQLVEFAQAGVDQATTMRELTELMEAKRKLSDSERKASLEAGHLMTAAQAVTILDRFVNSVMGVLADQPEKRREIHRQYAAVLGIHSPPEENLADAS